MNRIENLAQLPQVEAALTDLAGCVEAVVETAVSIQQIPAPTFAEAERAAYLETRFKAVGLVDVYRDEIDNVYGRLPGQSSDRPPVILSAHSDTVFPPETDLTVRRDANYVYGPGLGDNAVGLAGLLHLAKTFMAHDLPKETNIWFAANVCEEGLGNLRGMQAVVNRFGSEATYIILEGGLFGQISHQAIGVRRYRIDVHTDGGHSWGSFGQKSAIHELARLITAIDSLEMPQSPKTTYNVGMIEGGTSINTIAASASMFLDLRSEDPRVLDELVTAVTKIVKVAKNRLAGYGRATVTMTQIGSRPAGSIPRSTPLVQWAEAALQFVGCESPNFIIGSTDANIPLSQGITAVCVGLTESGNAHRLDEYIDIRQLSNGLKQLLLLAVAATKL
jgi:acetylornithine deacetylase/succinyl-diaminopimelate desuccinylase-like protein